MTEATRVRCCRATDRAQRHLHLCFDLLTPFSGDVLLALGAVRCPCGGITIVLTDTAPEPWEPGGADPTWEDECVTAREADDAENALPPVEDESDVPTDPVEAWREEHADRIDAEAGWDRTTDMLRALAHAVLDRAPEAHQIAKGVLSGESEPVLSMGMHAPNDRETGVSMSLSTHWAVHAMAANFGRSLGKAVNYMEMRFVDITAPGGRRTYVLTIQRPEGKTPHEMRVKAEGERDTLAAAVRAEREAGAALQRANEWMAITGELGMASSSRRVSEAKNDHISAWVAVDAALAEIGRVAR